MDIVRPPFRAICIGILDNAFFKILRGVSGYYVSWLTPSVDWLLVKVNLS